MATVTDRRSSCRIDCDDDVVDHENRLTEDVRNEKKKRKKKDADDHETTTTTTRRRAFAAVKRFYQRHPALRESASHGWSHVRAVVRHSRRAIACVDPPLSCVVSTEILLASLLHDVDDRKYFPSPPLGESRDHDRRDALFAEHGNATALLAEVGMINEEEEEESRLSARRVLTMIDAVSCSRNGNDVPAFVARTGRHHLLIPRWSDRLEAAGAAGVVRCRDFARESGAPLFDAERSPRPRTVDEVWARATPERFDAYARGGGEPTDSNDMMSHYYDKLLRVARPPPDRVRNAYLEAAARRASEELVEMCLRYGRTGEVDEAYVDELRRRVQAEQDEMNEEDDDDLPR